MQNGRAPALVREYAKRENSLWGTDHLQYFRVDRYLRTTYKIKETHPIRLREIFGEIHQAIGDRGIAAVMGLGTSRRTSGSPGGIDENMNSDMVVTQQAKLSGKNRYSAMRLTERLKLRDPSAVDTLLRRFHPSTRAKDQEYLKTLGVEQKTQLLADYYRYAVEENVSAAFRDAARDPFLQNQLVDLFAGTRKVTRTHVFLELFFNNPTLAAMTIK